MALSKEFLEKNLKIFFSVIKPMGVLKIDFDLKNFIDDRYHIDLKYIVPDGSDFLKRSRKEDPRYDWNTEIVFSVLNYFETRLIITSTSIVSESNYEKTKI